MLVAVLISVLWFAMVVTAFMYFARTAHVSGERFRVSLAGAILSVFCPFFSFLPICLNVEA